MKKKISKIIMAVAAVGIAGGILWYLYLNYLPNSFKKEKFFETSTLLEELELLSKSSSTETVDQITETRAKISRSGLSVLPYEENIIDVGEWFTVETEEKDWIFSCCVNNVMTTKEAIDTDAIYYLKNYPMIELDEEYTILNEYTYLVANVTVKNVGQTENGVYMNSILYVPYNDEIKDIDSAFNAGYILGYKTRADLPDDEKSYAKIMLEPGEEFTCNLIYVLADEDIDGKTSYLKYLRGIADEECDTPYIRIRL